MNQVAFTVPLVPPSVNHYVKHTRSGRHYVTKEAKAFKAATGIFARGKHVSSSWYEVEIAIFLAKGQRGDGDNFGKCVLDSLVAAGVIHSDAAVKKVSITKDRDWENPRTEITVKAIQEV
ncbi:MAG TPA: RusA family crossover junction endodeoxyribonuclease [Candidatus Angelobacter sp.]|jgi:crossover junction endodeoxyribonuclease RusA|nr:RusA family crossover junction endodeoxyribonuclease [Candidatus Angelobacter sp.]